jgi:hypothetical protein
MKHYTIIINGIIYQSEDNTIPEQIKDMEELIKKAKQDGKRPPNLEMNINIYSFQKALNNLRESLIDNNGAGPISISNGRVHRYALGAVVEVDIDEMDKRFASIKVLLIEPLKVVS